MFVLGYTIVSLLVAAADFALAFNAFHKRERTGLFLGLTCVYAGVTDVFYLASILSESYFWNSCFSSAYFVSVSVMLLNFSIFVVYFVKQKISRLLKKIFVVCLCWVLVELVAFAINPFKEFVISYIPRQTEFALFDYDMHLFFGMHLAFCYALVLAIFVLFVQKIIAVPKEYKRLYLYSVVGVLSIVGVNAVFLFVPDGHIYSMLDLSILGYSLIAYVLYWACFSYSENGMMDLFKMSVFENIDQGLILFDYNKKMILHNEMAERLLASVKLEKNMRLEQFQETCEIKIDAGGADSNFVFLHYMSGQENQIPLRCEYKVLRNAKNYVIGYLFMLASAVNELDPLTSFHTWENFKNIANENVGKLSENFILAACDISRLGFINGTMGHQYGDKKLKDLASLLKSRFPDKSYFVRGQDAVLMVFIQDDSETQVQKVMEGVVKDFDVHVLYAVSSNRGGKSPIEVADLAVTALKQKKLLDKDSAHAAILTSLVRALQECDNDTEEHVKRTQKLGAELGKRLGLSDVQQSQLSLLCLLHDIGKIGIPLEILNKPGKLTADEWNVLRTHVEKGYQIVMSSPDLSDIGDMVLHHHERWDGLGYPTGLSKESIPLLSRIISVVDAYDAMVNNRSYRSALPVEKAKEELRRWAGTQFDPSVVSEFLQLLEDQPSENSASEETVTPALEAMVREELEMGSTQIALHGVRNVDYCCYTVDEGMNIISVNDVFERLTGYSQQEIEANHMNHVDLIPEEDRTEYLLMVSESLSRQPNAFFEHRIQRKDSSIIYVLCYGRRYFDSAVRAFRSEIVFINATDTYAVRVMAHVERDKAKIREDRLEQISRMDSLTGLLNRAAFKSDTEQQLIEGKRKVMLLMLDVDHFKEFNDTYGHHAGDEFLQRIGSTLHSTLRRDDIAGRLGGDEFAAALFFDKNCTDEFMYERAQQIFDKINMTLKLSEQNTSLSMGAIISNEKRNTFNELYETADKALYVSKESGRSKFSIAKDA